MFLLFPNSLSYRVVLGYQKSLSVSRQGGKAVGRDLPGEPGHAAGQVRAGRAHFTFHCACGAILIPELNPELNDADPRVDLCWVYTPGRVGGVPPRCPRAQRF